MKKLSGIFTIKSGLRLLLPPQDCYFIVNKLLSGKGESGITHWHPTIYEIYDEVCKVGKHGSTLVLRTSGGGGTVLYSDEKENCPYSPYKKYLFGKYYYLRAV